MLTSFFSLLFSAQAMIWREERGTRKEGWGGEQEKGEGKGGERE